uniref:Protein phosphatase 1 regulatory subunit 12A-like n=1 Tax=Phallusia mammillata TaxID=59560 RepID=A0A6F9DPM8_9ASCI|nr:protein phosphatase 1 regulatory subunit 12A-like [Phallusia mammillata]
MDGSGRPLTAKEKRQEQLKRWENSATDSESAVITNWNPRVKFDDGAVFLAACSSGDLKEVGILLNKGADINFANVDGLTALHQACIDGNLDVVEYLVQHDINIDQEDNEGWTPLHAAASCGYMDIARYLVTNGANVAAVNSEGEVPLDIAEEDDMAEFLQQEVDNQGLDIEAARNQEREVMVNDATQYRNACLSGEKPILPRHPKSGATALHVAAAKGYIDAIRILLQAGVSPNVQDNDGWTPLHAASHWSQQEAAKLLSDRSGNFNIRSKLGQTPSDVADEEMLEYLRDLKKQQGERKSQISDSLIENPPSPTKGVNKAFENASELNDKSKNRENSLKSQSNSKHRDELSSSSDDDAEDSTSSSEVASSKTNQLPAEKPKKVENNVDHGRPPLGLSRAGSSDTVNLRSRENNENTTKLVQSASGGNVSSVGIRRSTRPASLHFPSSTTQKEVRPSVMSANSISNNRPVATTQPIQASQRSRNGPGVTPGTPTERNPDIKEGAPDTWRSGLRKTSSFDEKKKVVQRTSSSSSRSQLDTDKIPTGLVSKSTEDFSHKKTDIQTARVAPILDARTTNKSRKDSEQESSGYQRSSSYRKYGTDSAQTSSVSAPTFKRSISYKKAVGRTTSTDIAEPSLILNRGVKTSADENDGNATSASTQSTDTNSTSAGDQTKPDRRRSHLQPVRDEEAEAQRKARSRRERQSRRSTQGVTLDVYEEAKRQIENMKQERESSGTAGATSTTTKQSDTTDSANSSEITKIPHNDSVPLNLNWRHSASHTSASSTGSHPKPVTLPSSYVPSSERVKVSPRTVVVNSGSSVPSITLNDDTEKANNPLLDVDDDGDGKNEATPAGQSPSAKKSAAQLRRRQRKDRRSTGLPDLPPDANADNQSDEGDEIIKNDIDSVDVSKAERLRPTAARYETSSLPDRHNRHRSGLRGSDSDLPSRLASSVSNASEDRHANEKNYKKLYDEQCTENESLRSELAEARRKIAELESRLERAEDVAARRKAADTEKRERKVLERKLADMEKELMNNDERNVLQAKNLELKQENQALTRLVNKLGYPDEKQRSCKPSSLVEAFSGRTASPTAFTDATDSKPLVTIDDESDASEDEPADVTIASSSAKEKKKVEKTTSNSSSTSSVSEDTERRSSFSEKYSSSTTSRYTPKSDYSSSRDRVGYKSDYFSKYGRTDSSDYSSDRPHYKSGGSLREKRNAGLLTSSSTGKFPGSSSSPSLASGYHTIPVPSSRSRYINSIPPSSLSRTKLGSDTTSTVSSRYSDRRETPTSASSYRSRAYDPVKRSRSPVSFPSSANSKRVGELMNTYRLKN